MTAKGLVARARGARERAYAPYSGYKVGAAVLLRDGARRRVVEGCNVENASYGLSLCAERVALTAAVASLPDRAKSRDALAGRLMAIAIAVPEGQEATPCGACRQFMHELGPRMTVHLSRGDGGFRTTTVTKLLPAAFEVADLEAANACCSGGSCCAEPPVARRSRRGRARAPRITK